MKKCLFFISLAILFCSINLSAQTKNPVRKATTQKKSKANPAPKDSREYQVEDDGFEWYKVIKNGMQGAEDKNGNILIPCEFWSVIYIPYDKSNGGGFHVVYRGNYHGCGYYLRSGKCVIPFTRKYTFVYKAHDKDLGTYYLCSKEGSETICDINGQEKLEINMEPFGGSGHVDLESEEGHFYIEINTGKGMYVADGKGQLILGPINTNIILYDAEKKRFYEVNGNHEREYIGRVFNLQANPLANNPKEDPNSIVSSPSSNSSSSNSSRSSSASNNPRNGTSTIVVEHHHDPVPVQQWQACFACGGMGTMGCDNCGGSGTKYIGDRLHRCSRCNGRGIIPCNVCYGNKGQYVTVYK